MPGAESLTFLTRTNTLCIDVLEVHGGPKVPSKEWMNFLKSDVKVKSEEVIECNLHSLTNQLMVKFRSEEKYEEVKLRLQEGIPWAAKGGAKVFGWSVHEALSNVKLINVSCHMDESVILRKLAEYGKVVSHKVGFHADWPTVRDGSLTVKMKLAPEAVLPSFLTYGDVGEVIQIFNDQADRVCFRCLKKGHIAPFCRNRLVSAANVQPTVKSWASVVLNGASVKPVVEETQMRPPQMTVLGRVESPHPQGRAPLPPSTANECLMTNEVEPAPMKTVPTSTNELVPTEESPRISRKLVSSEENFPPQPLGPAAQAHQEADAAWIKAISTRNRGRDSSTDSVSQTKRPKKAGSSVKHKNSVQNE